MQTSAVSKVNAKPVASTRSHTSGQANVSRPASVVDTPTSPQNSPSITSDHAASGPFVSSFDDPDRPESSARLGYKDELEVRFIWDRVLGRGRNGTVVRAVIDRFTGVEYACKRMPKTAQPEVRGETEESRAKADAEQIAHISREITLFTKLRSSLNVARLEQAYEDKTYVYLVMEKCSGPSLTDVADKGDVEERDVGRYMRSVVRTITQCHDAGQMHGDVSPAKFMLLSEDREAPVKATGFGRFTQGGLTSITSGVFLTNMAALAPEMLSKTPAIGKSADTWAAGLVATKLLTGYFPFDDIIENAIDTAGVLPDFGPLKELFDSPLMPSGAALLVSALVMLLDFSRPHWGPVSLQARDWVVKCLQINPGDRQSPLHALQHPWLKRFRLSTGSEHSASLRSIVQRIQRFGSYSELKRTALEHIAKSLLKQNASAAAHASGSSNTLPTAKSLYIEDEEPGAGLLSGVATPLSPLPAMRTSTASSVSLDPIAEGGSSPKEAGNATAGVHGGAGGPQQFLADAQKYHGLLDHVLVSDGTINRFSLTEGLAKLGYTVSDADIDHLLRQLSTVPGLGSACAVTQEAFAASQIEWRGDEWREMARTAFDALDLDGDGHVQRNEMELVLAGRCPPENVQEAINQAMVDSGQEESATSIDFDAFLLLLGDEAPTESMPLNPGPSIEKFASMRQTGCSTSLSATLRMAFPSRRSPSTWSLANSEDLFVGDTRRKSESPGECRRWQHRSEGDVERTDLLPGSGTHGCPPYFVPRLPSSRSLGSNELIVGGGDGGGLPPRGPGAVGGAMFGDDDEGASGHRIVGTHRPAKDVGRGHLHREGSGDPKATSFFGLSGGNRVTGEAPTVSLRSVA